MLMILTRRGLARVNDYACRRGLAMNRRKQSPSGAADWVRGPGPADGDGDVERGQSFLVTSDPHLPSDEGPARGRWTPLLAVAYFLLAGIVSLTIGAAVSLAASGTGRLALWAGVTGAIAIAAGIAYDSRLVRGLGPVLRNRGSQLGRP
jgi:hypothetical protein